MVRNRSHLPVHDDRVQPFLAAEVLVDDRLGDAGLGRDLLDRGAVEATLGEQVAADVEELLAPFLAGHPLPVRVPVHGWLACHCSIMANRWPVSESRAPPAGPRPRDAAGPSSRAAGRCRSAARSASRSAGPRPASARRKPGRAARPPRCTGPRCRSDRAARRAGRRSGRRGAGCARTRRRTGSPASHTLPDLSRTSNGALAERVADRVDRPGDVVQQGDADQAGPEERGHRALPRPRPQPADHGREPQATRTRSSRERPSTVSRCRGPRAGPGLNFAAEVCSASNSQPMCA